MKYILFTGGGSAGHVVPNLAIINELRYSYKVAYMGTSGMERALVEKQGLPYFCVDTPKFIRKFTFENAKIPFRLRKAVSQAEKLLRADPPDLVFSKGGYASYPAARAAQRLKIPLFTHESDLSAGLCTKLLAKGSTKVLTSFPQTAERFPNGLCVGSPMRKELFAGDKLRARKKYGFPKNKPVLLVLGGGSGSKALNDFVWRNLSTLLKEFCILHLCGRGNAVSSPFHDYVQREYEGDMGSAYACADVALSRAGSNTLFELLALKIPSVLVPLAKSSRGDQVENAVYFARKGVCFCVRESELSDKGISALREARESRELLSALADCRIENGTPQILKLIKETLR